MVKLQHDSFTLYDGTFFNVKYIYTWRHKDTEYDNKINMKYTHHTKI